VSHEERPEVRLEDCIPDHFFLGTEKEKKKKRRRKEKAGIKKQQNILVLGLEVGKKEDILRLEVGKKEDILMLEVGKKEDILVLEIGMKEERVKWVSRDPQMRSPKRQEEEPSFHQTLSL